MKKMIGKIVIIGCALLALNGCTAYVPKREEVKWHDFGPPISKTEFENKVRNGMGFFDPYSAVIACSEPRKAFGFYDYDPKYGWLAYCKYNAKNRMGAYVGEKVQAFLKNNNGALFELDNPRNWTYFDDLPPE